MGTWNSSLSSDPPRWWNQKLTDACVRAARGALPNEICGLITAPLTERISDMDQSQESGWSQHTGFIDDESSLLLHLFHGYASPTSVAANPQEVIQFAYQLKQQNRVPIATFHSHPGGQMRFSERDEMLRMWARHHAVAVKRANAWTLMFIS
ncbi:Mov34/MPN/PAD-1 family protein [Alicyclobacillus ferrooxydans]|uniref:Mov34/MPN/PAD-1 family protein n=1 Tax=Alicyclobacillus ferrooxydans TaxID=471514 RepID=UPI0014700248|nr:Mov34/MPN/PAD-1 family protein [Alicyclobacillus ferrooxydans]